MQVFRDLIDFVVLLFETFRAK